jgi:hypothetical protein
MKIAGLTAIHGTCGYHPDSQAGPILKEHLEAGANLAPAFIVAMGVPEFWRVSGLK